MKHRLTILLLLIASTVYGQRSSFNRNPFLSTQWYLGFFAGGNYAMANPSDTYYGYAPLNYNISALAKNYNDFSKMGAQAGLVFMFYTQGFTIGLKPGIHSYSIDHTTTASWTDGSNPDNQLRVNYMHTTGFNYVEFPLTVQYDFLRDKIRPFAGVGGYYGLLINATRTIERSGTDSASGAAGGFSDQAKTIGITDLYITSAVGIMGFIGASYDPGNIRITIDIGYKLGLNNITNSENRYLNNDLTAIGEAMDDISLQNLYFSMGFLFPLKFISKNYNSIN